MTSILDFFSNFNNPDWIVQHGGMYLIALIVFAETGLFAGFFLPGDSLLFIAGIIIGNTSFGQGDPQLYLLYWILLVATAGILGNFTGYWFGRKAGPGLLAKPDTWLFKKKYFIQAKNFYEKKGGSAIVIARFLPVIRTFAPIVAGMVCMDFRKFSFYNIVGSLVWSGSIITGGFLLGEIKFVHDNLHLIILGIVGITTIPVIFKMLSVGKSSSGTIAKSVS
ncbi:MAG: VTT domain-containing protein [Chitinophagaceae bacterium]